MGKRKFKKAVKALGKKYGQDAVITQTKGGRRCYTKENPQGWITEEKYTNRKNETTGSNWRNGHSYQGKDFYL